MLRHHSRGCSKRRPGRRWAGLVACGLLAAVLTALLAPGQVLAQAALADPNIGVQINGHRRAFDPAPFIQDGRTLVPLRGIFEALGAQIEWDGETQTVTATRGSRVIRLTIGAGAAQVNGEPVPLDVPALIRDGRTFVPLRFVSEALGAAVGWHQRTRTAVVVDFHALHGDGGPAPGSALALLRAALANQAEPDGDVTASLHFGSPDPGQNHSIDAVVRTFRRGADAYWLAEQKLNFGGFMTAAVSALVQRDGQTWAKRPLDRALAPAPGAGVAALGLPGGLDPTRPLANPLIGAVQTVVAGEQVILDGQDHRTLVVTFAGNQLYDFFQALVRHYGTDLTGVTFRKLQAMLLVRESDGFIRRTAVAVDWLHTWTDGGELVETPWELRLTAEWSPPAGPVPWPPLP